MQGKSIHAFASLFLHDHRNIVIRKDARFTTFLRNSSAGTLFARPKTMPTWTAHMIYHPPMPYVLQSSYEDVEAELNVLRNRHLAAKILFIGGDGLSINRVNHLINQKPDFYLYQTPLIVPRMGEAPHGVYHVMHAGWRLYIRFIRICADKLGNEQVRDDPPVKDFNASLFFLWRMTRAVSEYLVHLSGTPLGPDLDNLDEWRRGARLNSDFAWLFHFLYDYAYLVLDFKQSVRAGDGGALDAMWREFLGLGRCSTANKTQYVPMAILRIFWSETMHPQLAALYQATRSIPLSEREGAMVGWDHPIELLNGAITRGVQSHVSLEHIEQFLKIYPLLEHNHTVLREWTMPARDRYASKMKDMDSDVGRLKEWFMQSVGSDWLSVCACTAQLNSIPPGPQLVARRGRPPWEEVEATMTQHGASSVPAFVGDTVRRLTNNFYEWKQ